MKSPHVLVTGATGNVGGVVLSTLRAAGISTTAARSPDAPGFDFRDSRTWDAALRGVDRVFLMRPPHISNIRRDMRPFLEYVSQRGIDYLAFLSVQGAENSSIVPHAKIEAELERLAIPHATFRPSFFMQNLTTTHLQEIRDERRIFVPAGDGATNFVDTRDVGEAIARTLIDPPPGNAAYTVTGPREYTYHEVVDVLSRATGEHVYYESARLIPFLRYHAERGRKLGQAVVMYLLYSVTRMGRAGTATQTLAALLGREPTTLEEFILEHRELFLQNSYVYDSDELPPESRFGEAISILNRAAHIYLTRELAPYELGPGQQAYLLTLSSGEAVSQDEIARRHRVDKANAARAVQTLERLGYVRRVRASDDQRRWDVSLTREGVAVKADVQRILGGWVGSLAEAVSPEEWQATVRSLSKIAEAAMERARDST